MYPGRNMVYGWCILGVSARFCTIPPAILPWKGPVALQRLADSPPVLHELSGVCLGAHAATTSAIQHPTRTMCSEQPQAIGSHLLVYPISVMHLVATPIWSTAWLTLRMDSWHADVDRSAAHAFPQTFQETKARSHPLPTPAGLSNVVWLLSQPPPGWMQPQFRGKYWGNLLPPSDLDKLSCKVSYKLS